MSVNQFIREIHDRFYRHVGVGLEDIWLYRFATAGKSSFNSKLSFYRMTYDEVNNAYVPLFSKRLGKIKRPNKEEWYSRNIIDT